jgi:exodeoxyribonuclease VII large subunit
MDITSPKILTVSQLNMLARKTLENSFNYVLIAGEISNLVQPSSGHIYFSLKDEIAQVRAVMFRQKNIKLQFEPQNGMQVIVTAQVSLYEPRGDYQLIIEQMEMVGVGALYAKFIQLKNKLEKLGLFSLEHKKSLPRIPTTIGIITSPTGAAIRDLLTILNRRFPLATVIIYPVVVQGTEAATQIVTALQVANQRHECQVLILARGGGTIEDLWPFNEELVAEAIFASHIPIISAIGHETDFTIADFVADIRAPTPSAAAELVAPNINEWQQTIENFSRRLINLVCYQLRHLNLVLTNINNRLQSPKEQLIKKNLLLKNYQQRLLVAIKHQLTYRQQFLAAIIAALNSVSPLATLARGYTILRKNSTIVSSVTDTNVGETVQAQLKDGELTCLVTAVEK